MKKIRLSRETYEMGLCFSVTINVHGRVRIFNDDERAQIALTALHQASEKYRAHVYAYCLMPDHLHVLALLPPDVNLIDYVRHFKQLSAFRLKRLAGKPVEVWQTRFYDHAVRSDEALDEIVTYIWHNPVRAGIVDEPDAYAYSGSIELEETALGSEDPNLRVAAAP